MTVTVPGDTDPARLLPAYVRTLQAQQDGLEKTSALRRRSCIWAFLDLNQGPTDYESAALTN